MEGLATKVAGVAATVAAAESNKKQPSEEENQGKFTKRGLIRPLKYLNHPFY